MREANRLSLRLDVEDPLVLLTNFLSLPPPSSGDRALAARWMDAFLGLVATCRARRSDACLENARRTEIILQLPWDDWEDGDWLALAVDQACCYSPSAGEGTHLEFAHAVDKRLLREDSVDYSSLIGELTPGSDQVVIISYADDRRSRGVLGEARSILKSLPPTFLDAGRQVLCNKRRRVIQDGLLRGIVPGEPLVSSPVRTTQKARLREARVVWLHNALKRDVVRTLGCLPPEDGLIVHLIGRGAKRGLRIHDHALGDALRARDLKKDPRWRQKEIKLLYLSLSSESAEALLGDPGDSFPHQLLRDSPLVAATVCFRWALPRQVVRVIAEAFYETYLERDGTPLDASRSLFEARKRAYERWQGGGGAHEWRYYCVWAAPMLITQDKGA